MSYIYFIVLNFTQSRKTLFCCNSLWLVFPIFSVDFIINANFHMTDHCFTLIYTFNIKWHWFSPHTSFILLLIILRSLHLSLLGYLHIKIVLDENLCTRVTAFSTFSWITASSTCDNYCSPADLLHSLLH